MDTLSDYARGYGFPYSTCPDPVYTVGLPRFLDVLAERHISATIFVIARDAQVPEHAAVLRRAVDEGHELANHTFTHPRRLASLADGELQSEIRRAHDVISEIRGTPVTGFRAPCYDIGRRVLSELRTLGYLYDSSVHPTVLAPLIDFVVLIKSGFRQFEARPGTYMHLFAPLRPYRPSARCLVWPTAKGSLVELPLSALPLFRLPFYGTFAHATGMKLFRSSLWWLRSWRRALNFHFHAVELVDLNDAGVDQAFAVHPGMQKSVSNKSADVREMIERFVGRYDLMPLEDLARQFLDTSATDAAVT